MTFTDMLRRCLRKRTSDKGLRATARALDMEPTTLMRFLDGQDLHSRFVDKIVAHLDIITRRSMK